MAEEDVQKVEIQNKEEMAKSIADKITNQQQSTFDALSQSTISATQSTTVTQTNTIIDSVKESAQSTTDSINSMMDVQTAGAAAEKALAIESRREKEKTDQTRHSEFLDAINNIKLAVAPPE